MNFFHFNNQFLCQNNPFHYFQSLWEHEEDGKLHPIAGLESRVGDWQLVRAQSRVHICFISQCGDRTTKNMGQVAILLPPQYKNLTTRVPRLIYVNVLRIKWGLVGPSKTQLSYDRDLLVWRWLHVSAVLCHLQVISCFTINNNKEKTYTWW